MDSLMFLLLLFSKILVVVQCFPQDSSSPLTKRTSHRSSGLLSTETAKAAIISRSLLSLPHTGRKTALHSERNRKYHVFPTPRKQNSFSSLIKELTAKNFASQTNDGKTNRAYMKGQISVLPTETMLDNRMLPITKKQKKLMLPTEDDDSINNLIATWQLVSSTLKKTKDKKKDRETAQRQAEDDIINNLRATWPRQGSNLENTKEKKKDGESAQRHKEVDINDLRATWPQKYITPTTVMSEGGDTVTSEKDTMTSEGGDTVTSEKDTMTSEEGDKVTSVEGDRVTPVVGDTVMCFLCTTVMGEMKQTMNDPQMEKNMEDAMENGLCPFVPEGLDCKTKVHTFGPILFEMIHREMDPMTFCQDMAMCADPSPSFSRLHGALDAVRLAADVAQKSSSAASTASVRNSVPSQRYALNSVPESALDPTQDSPVHLIQPASVRNSVSSQNPALNSVPESLQNFDPQSDSDSTQDSPASQNHPAVSILQPASVQNPSHFPNSALQSLQNSDPRSDSDSTQDSHASKNYAAASLIRPATDSKNYPAQVHEPSDPDSHAQSPLSSNLVKLVSAYLCRSHGICRADSEVDESRESSMKSQVDAEAVNDDVQDTSLKFLPNARFSRDHYRDDSSADIGLERISEAEGDSV
ncbi:hypothetical protein V1264_019889 [Littorina saxatilis]|uniref:Saposin B-type domain-containing protein n=1 Tax=Littorina saxatilis TaxID=31220 RepID=A0AAN9BDL9_9CAEN